MIWAASMAALRGVVYTDGRHRDSRGHLHDGVERIDSTERTRGNGHPDDRQRRMRRHHPRAEPPLSRPRRLSP